MCKDQSFVLGLELPNEADDLQHERRTEYMMLLVRGFNDWFDRHRQSAQQPEQPVPPTGQMLISRFQSHPLSDDFIYYPSDHTSDGGSSRDLFAVSKCESRADDEPSLNQYKQAEDASVFFIVLAALAPDKSMGAKELQGRLDVGQTNLSSYMRHHTVLVRVALALAPIFHKEPPTGQRR
ncbi:hypothetical protein IE81DRAFT_341946 [Ceraceosorus guamensis]|uniref:Uncharacterized protein n=1 Tax=Ceraceosorus guamensis TaxID=1522189 RepID=A0A316VWA8_9BASI|nr:hypothetical protein IE81DRAFT_341946 [Ceraceosorus guamensis]PWN41584.1 hypothetical protein IE81DRAFT_341946 [Ceraceosorus guamensis]